MESKVSKSGTVKIPFKSTPAYLHNGLTSCESYFSYASNNGDHLCTIFQIKTDTMPYPKTEEYHLKSEDGQEITELKYVRSQGQSKLVLTFNNGYKIYSEDGKRLLNFFKVPEKDQKFYKDNSVQNYFQGVASGFTKDENEIICVGNSIGEVYFVQNVKEGTYSTNVGLSLKNGAAISHLASSHSHNLLFVADNQGFLYVYSLDSAKAGKFIKTIDLNNQNNPVTSMCVYETASACYLFVGDLLGKIRVYDVLTFNLVIDIAAHFRAVTSLDVNPTLNRFISTSEDTYLNVWKVNIENGINLVLMKSYNSDDKMIMGGRILDKPKFNVMIAQYECDEISVLTALT